MVTLQAVVIAEGNKDLLAVCLHPHALHVSPVVVPHVADLQKNRHLMILVPHCLVEGSRGALELKRLAIESPDLRIT